MPRPEAYPYLEARSASPPRDVGQDEPEGTIVIAEHQHKADGFDPDHCRACAVDAGLLDHYERVQLHESALVAARRLASQAQRYAIVTMWLSGLALVVALIALLVSLFTG
jgi:hypothetical protein